MKQKTAYDLARYALLNAVKFKTIRIVDSSIVVPGNLIQIKAMRNFRLFLHLGTGRRFAKIYDRGTFVALFELDKVDKTGSLF